MSCCDEDTITICPCGSFIHPRVIFNPPGRDTIAYRVGDYATFRHALLQARAGENELSRADGTKIEQIWRPSATGDLALQMIEWWAYLADVLTFYNERVASQAYLRTADLPESVDRLIRLLGYRPRPGIGATGVLAALAGGPKPFTLPKGFQVQSKPGPGKLPQVFELDAETRVGALITGSPTSPQGEMNADPTPDAALAQVGQDNSVVLKGASSALKKGDRVLFLKKEDPLPPDGFAAATVINVSHQKDPQAGAITKIQVNSGDDLSKVQDVTKFRLLKSDQSAQVWQYPAGKGKVVRTDGDNGRADLAVIARGIKIKDPILFEVGSAAVAHLVSITSSSEVVWFANPKNFAPPAVPGDTVDPSVPPDPTTPPFPIPHTSIAFTPKISEILDDSDTSTSRATILIRYGWKAVGDLIAIPAGSVGSRSGGSEAGSDTPGNPVNLQAASGSSFPSVSSNAPVLVEDANGDGDTGTLDTSSNLKLDDPVPLLIPPLRVLFNLLQVTRGKSVTNEVLGNGNGALAGQGFVLQNAPVTYLSDNASKGSATTRLSVSGEGYSSTVRVWVNGLEWSEVRSFYGQPAAAQIFVTREDEQGKTHVLFGDGEHGARLPTGVNNIVAAYRYGSGAETPDAGSLTVVLQPQPGLKAIRNPVRVGGGSDPDPPGKIRKLAPKSVLTFNRAVSADDYETIAAQAPGVTRARALFSFDAIEQRPLVKIWVGDDAGAVKSAQKALAGTTDPNCPPRIQLATKIVITIALTLVVDPRRQPESVQAAVHDALVDPDNGLLGVNVVGIGQAFYDSQIYAACLAVPGVDAVHNLNLSLAPVSSESAIAGGMQTTQLASLIGLLRKFSLPLHRTAQTAFFSRQAVMPACQCDHRHDPGEGGFFFLPDDVQHLSLS